MEFAIISPTSGLERYATLSKTHLVLHHVLDPNYYAFYQKRSDEGEFIILDNGAYEGREIDIELWKDQVAWYSPDVAVLPDFYLQPWRNTWHAAIAFLDKFYHKYDPIEWLYIPQAVPGDYHGFISSYFEAVSDSRITWIGIPRCLATDIARNPLARVEFARLVRAEYPHIKLHAFGMVNGDIHEIPYLAAAGVTSIDSSAPVNRGLFNLSLTKPDDRKFWDEHGEEVKFDQPLPNAVYDWDQQVLRNLEACGVRIPNR